MRKVSDMVRMVNMITIQVMNDNHVNNHSGNDGDHDGDVMTVILLMVLVVKMITGGW